MIKPGRSFSSSTYKHGFNTNESDAEITGSFGNTYTAEYWMYDSRLGRRWERDPITYPWQSPYACFNNNPIYYNDVKGLEGNAPTGNVDTDIPLPPSSLSSGGMPEVIAYKNIFHKIFYIAKEAFKEVTALAGNFIAGFYFAHITNSTIVTAPVRIGVDSNLDQIIDSPSERAAFRTGELTADLGDMAVGIAGFISSGGLTIATEGLAAPVTVPTAIYSAELATVSGINAVHTIYLMVEDANQCPVNNGVGSEEALSGGEPTGIPDLTGASGVVPKTYSEATYKAFEKQLAEDGMKSILKTKSTIQRRLAEHLQKLEEIKKAGGYSSSVEREIKTFQSQLDAINDLIK